MDQTPPSISIDDQLSARCPVCGRLVSFDRWSYDPQDFICSDVCKDALKRVYGIKSHVEVIINRASNPDVCVVCAAPMNEKTHVDAVFCSSACKKRAQRLGVNGDGLRAIRLSSINGENRP